MVEITCLINRVSVPSPFLLQVGKKRMIPIFSEGRTFKNMGVNVYEIYI
jgi:hypothetical protein